jgi:hypothetical protein
MGRGRHNPGPLLAALAATTAAATAVLAAHLAAARRQRAASSGSASSVFASSAGRRLRPGPTPPRHLADTPPPVEPRPVDPPASTHEAQPSPQPHERTTDRLQPGADQPSPADQPAASTPQPPAAGQHQPSSAGPLSTEGDRSVVAGMGAPRHLAGGSGRGRALVGVVVAGGVVIVLGVGALVMAGTGSEGTDAATDTTTPREGTVTTEASTTTTTVVAPQEAFGSAAGRLEAAGTFAYAGSVSASDVSAVRPSLWLAVDLTVEGEASLADGRVHEVAVAGNGRATETVVAGVEVWGRSARTREGLVGQGYEGIPELSRPEPATKGVASLARWLAAVEEPVAAGVDGQGRRLYRGTLPAAVLGPTERGRRAVDAEVLLAMDRAGVPVHVEITTVAGGPPMHMVLELSGLGAPVVIEVPGTDQG